MLELQRRLLLYAGIFMTMIGLGRTGSSTKKMPDTGAWICAYFGTILMILLAETKNQQEMPEGVIGWVNTTITQAAEYLEDQFPFRQKK